MLRLLVTFGCLVAATTFESFGDATLRIGLFNRVGLPRIAVMLAGGILLFGYGLMLNLAPLPFERVVGLYIALLFCAWQVATFVMFRTLPTVPVLVGGVLIVSGGLVVTFWSR
jgi:hypothetical protein